MIDQSSYKKCQHHPQQVNSIESTTPLDALPVEFEEIKSLDEDSDTISFYSDDTESDRMSKLSKEDFAAVIDTDGDEGFYDKSEIRRLVQWFLKSQIFIYWLHFLFNK